MFPEPYPGTGTCNPGLFWVKYSFTKDGKCETTENDRMVRNIKGILRGSLIQSTFAAENEGKEVLTIWCNEHAKKSNTTLPKNTLMEGMAPGSGWCEHVIFIEGVFSEYGVVKGDMDVAAKDMKHLRDVLTRVRRDERK